MKIVPSHRWEGGREFVNFCFYVLPSQASFSSFIDRHREAKARTRRRRVFSDGDVGCVRIADTFQSWFRDSPTSCQARGSRSSCRSTRARLRAVAATDWLCDCINTTLHVLTPLPPPTHSPPVFASFPTTLPTFFSCLSPFRTPSSVCFTPASEGFFRFLS